MGNVPKRQQPDHKKNNTRRSPTGLQCSEKFPHSEVRKKFDDVNKLFRQIFRIQEFFYRSFIFTACEKKN